LIAFVFRKSLSRQIPVQLQAMAASVAPVLRWRRGEKNGDASQS
jgi:hypothetical protein